MHEQGAGATRTSAFKPGTSATKWGTAAGIWGAVTAIVAFFWGGWVGANTREALTRGSSAGQRGRGSAEGHDGRRFR